MVENYSLNVPKYVVSDVAIFVSVSALLVVFGISAPVSALPKAFLVFVNISIFDFVSTDDWK